MGTFSFDFYKNLLPVKAGWSSPTIEISMSGASEYADHGTITIPEVGRALEGRKHALGFNYRMNELQGAVGLAQLPA